MARLPQLPDSPSPTHGQTLAYDSTIQRWVPSAPASGGGTTDHAALSNRSAADQHPIGAVTGLQSALDGKAASSHQHNASDVNAGTLAIARIPTGTTSSTVALGNHTHADYAPRRQTVATKTGTTYTPVLADETALLLLSNTGSITVTLPADTSLAIPVGGRIDFLVTGTGMATFVAGSGATVHATPSAVTRAQYSAVSAVKVSANTWAVVGDLA